MKDWICWVILIVCVAAIIYFSWYLTTIFSTMTIFYITVVLNSVMFGYLYYQDKK